MGSTATQDLVRDLYERWGAAEPGGVDYVEVDAGGVPAMWITPTRAAADRVIVAIHGGGFVTGSMYTHRKLFGHVAKAAGARALAVDYRRTPEHAHPAPVQDSRSFAEHARAAGVEVRLDVFPGRQHTFQMAAGRSPVADDAIGRLAEWLRPRLGL